MIFESVARVGLDMPIFQPVLVTPGNLPREQETRMFGREEEQNFLERAISELQDGQPSGIILIEGEEGMGKTMLMNHVQRYAKGQHVPCYYSAADCMEKVIVTVKTTSLQFSAENFLVRLAKHITKNVGHANS